MPSKPATRRPTRRLALGRLRYQLCQAKRLQVSQDPAQRALGKLLEDLAWEGWRQALL